tara:strand:- start:407 stop:643 length:237 start_codon:yes stop_codon:yes gene_type:complete
MKSTPTNAVAVTPSDSADLAKPSYLYVHTGGTLRVTLANMADGTYVDYNPGDDRDYSFIAKRVWTTGTTATGIIAQYD